MKNKETTFLMIKVNGGFYFNAVRNGEIIIASKIFKSGDECLEFINRIAINFEPYQIIVKSVLR